jgi:hypothetical protein
VFQVDPPFPLLNVEEPQNFLHHEIPKDMLMDDEELLTA